MSPEFAEIIAEEVNVKEVKYSDINIETLASLDTVITESLKAEGVVRELVRQIQSLRKKTGFEVEDRINLSYQTKSEFLDAIMVKMKDIIAKEVLANSIENKKTETEGSEEYTIEDEIIWIGINRIRITD